MPGSEPVQSLSRGLDILLAVAGSEDGLRLNELSERLDLGSSTVHNLVRTMRLKGFIEKGADGKLRPGAVLSGLSGGCANGRLLRKISAAMEALSQQFPKAILTYSEIIGSEISVVMRMSPDMPGTVQRPSGRTFLPYYNVSGLLFLAFADAEALSSLRLNHPFAEEGLRHWASEGRLEAYLKQTRDRGHGESPFPENGALLVAAPVFDPGNMLRGVLGVSLALKPHVEFSKKALIEALLVAAGGARS